MSQDAAGSNYALLSEVRSKLEGICEPSLLGWVQWWLLTLEKWQSFHLGNLYVGPALTALGFRCRRINKRTHKAENELRPAALAKTGSQTKRGSQAALAYRQTSR